MEKVRVIVYGVGAMGSRMVRMMLDKEGIEVVGGIDVAEEKVGRDVGEVSGVGKNLGIIVSGQADAILQKTKADIVLHATPISRGMESEIMKAIEGGLNVITLADVRLTYPWVHWPELGQRVDEAAKRNGVTVLSTGFRPGFIADLVPIVFSGVCASIERIEVRGVVDWTFFGVPTLMRMGFGLTVDEFKKTLGGRPVSPASPPSTELDMIADALGWKLSETGRTLDPVTSKKRKRTLYGMEIESGTVCGFKEVCYGILDGEAVITLELNGVVDPEDEGLGIPDSVSIKGEPDLDIVVKGSKSDAPFYAHAVNAIPQVMEARPGLVTVRDLAVAAALK
jgi:hypothetical protein